MRIEPMQVNNDFSSLAGINKKGFSIEELVGKVFEDKDGDKDGALSIEELGISEEKFSRIDENSDGLIGVEEMVEPLKALDMMAMQNNKSFNNGKRLEKMSSKIIENMDMNGDGVLSIDELGSSQELFSFFDSNQDGFVDQDELTEGIRALKIEAENKLIKASKDSEKKEDEVEIVGNGIDDDGDGEIDEVDANSIFSSFYSAADAIPSANLSESEDKNSAQIDIIA